MPRIHKPTPSTHIPKVTTDPCRFYSFGAKDGVARRPCDEWGLRPQGRGVHHSTCHYRWKWQPPVPWINKSTPSTHVPMATTDPCRFYSFGAKDGVAQRCDELGLRPQGCGVHHSTCHYRWKWQPPVPWIDKLSQDVCIPILCTKEPPEFMSLIYPVLHKSITCIRSTQAMRDGRGRVRCGV